MSIRRTVYLTFQCGMHFTIYYLKFIQSGQVKTHCNHIHYSRIHYSRIHYNLYTHNNLYTHSSHILHKHNSNQEYHTKSNCYSNLNWNVDSNYGNIQMKSVFFSQLFIQIALQVLSNYFLSEYDRDLNQTRYYGQEDIMELLGLDCSQYSLFFNYSQLRHKFE